MNDFLTKPFFEDELIQLVQHWISRGASEAVGTAAACAAAATEMAKLYSLDILLTTARGNQQFIVTMLQTFIDGTTKALYDLSRALAVGNVPGLHATAHKLRPSLMHLHIQPVLVLIDRLENWETEFSYDDLQPIVETADRLLRQVLAEMTMEVERFRAAMAG